MRRRITSPLTALGWAAALLTLSGTLTAQNCNAAPYAPHEPCDQGTAQSASLEVLQPALGNAMSGLGAWLGDDTSSEIARQRGLIRSYRGRVALIRSVCAREAYVGWLDYYQRGTNEAEAENRDHKIGLQQKAFEQQLKQENAASKRLLLRGFPRP